MEMLSLVIFPRINLSSALTVVPRSQQMLLFTSVISAASSQRIHIIHLNSALNVVMYLMKTTSSKDG